MTDESGHTCNQKPHALVADANGDVKILFQLDNAQGKPVVIEGVLCTTAPSGNIRKDDFTTFSKMLSSPVQMNAGESATVGDALSDIDDVIICVDEDGTDLQMAAGSNFRGSLAIIYSFVDDVPGAPSRLAVATVSGNVQAE